MSDPVDLTASQPDSVVVIDDVHTVIDRPVYNADDGGDDDNDSVDLYRQHNESPIHQHDNTDVITATAATIPINIHIPHPITHHQVTDTDAAQQQSGLHVLPCHIQYTGPANVTTYFTSTIKPYTSFTATTTTAASATQLYTATLRGRQLTGECVRLGVGCVGVVVNDDIKQNNKIITNAAVDSSPSAKRAKHTDSTAPAAAAGHQHVQWTVDSTFDAMWLWNRDEQLHERDYVKRSLTQMIELNNAIHSPVPVT